MCITKNFNPPIITTLNGCLQNWCSQTLKRLHQLLCKQESPRKCCSCGGKALWKPPYQSSGSESLKCFGLKMSRRAEDLGPCLHSLSTATWFPALTSGPGRRNHCISTHLDRLFLSFIYRILCLNVELLREEFRPVYCGGPFTADKNYKV